MTLHIELSDEETRILERKAKGLGTTVEQLASSAVRNLLQETPDQPTSGMDVDAAIEFVVRKNKELYKRLA